MKVEVSNHAGRRYCERIKDIPEKGSGPYYLQNKEQIDGELIKLYTHAKMFFSGKIKTHPNRQYLKHQNIIIVANNDSIVTLFKVKFGNLSVEKTVEVLDIMMEDLQVQLSDRTEKQEEIKNQIDTFNQEIDDANNEIKRLQGLIEIEKHHINANKEYKEAVQKQSKQLDYGIHDTFEAIIGKGFAGEL